MVILRAAGPASVVVHGVAAQAALAAAVATDEDADERTELTNDS